MPVLDDLSGYEFEDLMAEVFRELGFENVRVAQRAADVGRDVIMEEVVDGERRAVIVECKHTGTVGRPVVQKLHSAIATFDYDGPKRGMIVTTGQLTSPAQEYAAALERTGDPHLIEVLDGHDLRNLADEVGLDLKNGRIEILCDETLRPTDPTGDIRDPFDEAFADVRNIDAGSVPAPHTAVTFRPTLVVTADVQAVFETSVGVVHRVDERDRVAIFADRGEPTVAASTVSRLIRGNLEHTVALDEDAFAETFDAVEVRRFGRTKSEYTDWVTDRLIDRHTTTVRYTGDNNVTYTKTCEPGPSDVHVRRAEPVYLPELHQSGSLGEYEYDLRFFAAGPSRVTIGNGIRQCVHCGADGADETYTYCANCGSVNCETHTKTERLTGEPVCTGCAVTERFAFRTKYFYDEQNLESFRETYDAMPVHEKAMENKPLVAGSVIAIVVATLGLLASVGVV